MKNKSKMHFLDQFSPPKKPEIENGRPSALKFDAKQDAVVKSWKISKEKGAIFIFPKKSELSPRYYLKEGGLWIIYC